MSRLTAINEHDNRMDRVGPGILETDSGFDTSYLIVPWPSGSNETETIISGVPFNLTTLEYWNYTLYSNDTISNVSKCYLTFEPYQPAYIFPNGSWTNSTSCYTNVFEIGPRAGVGLGFVVALGVCLIMSTVNLTRLGRQFLPPEKRFAPVGRRWQWYWSIAACAFGMVSLITNIDVDRYYLPQIPIVLNVFFWFLMQLASMASVWEAVRHWGSWMERQIVDPGISRLRLDDMRAKVEFYLPLTFYLCWWLNFFMVIPRSWTAVEHQRYPGQAEIEAEPMATDGRFKAAGFILLVAWGNICVSLGHSAYHYHSTPPERTARSQRVLSMIPLRFTLTLPAALGLVVYQIICSFDFDDSPLKVGTNLAAMYAGGYVPTVLILVLHNAFGFLTDNEDKALICQRRGRGQEWNREHGHVPKPRWWDLVKFGNTAGLSVEERLARFAHESGTSGRPQGAEELLDMQAQVRPGQIHTPASAGEPQADESPPPYSPASPETAARLAMQRNAPEADRNTAASEHHIRRENSISGPPRQVRSMLDV